MSLVNSPLSRARVTRTFASPAAKAIVSLAMLVASVAVLASNYDLSEVIADLTELSPATVAVISSALLANAILAVLRFKIIAADMGHRIPLSRAMTTVSAGNLAGALFFQLAGQLIARGTIMGRGGIPFANVIVITLYERVVAAIISALIAVAGGYLVFGRIYIDPQAGGTELIRLLIGLIAATTVGALIGYGNTAAKAIVPLISDHLARSLLRILTLTLFVQIPMMVAYVAAAHALSRDVPLVDLTAAAAIVMFAASVPISLAGWGVREMSAVAALGIIGVSGHAAFTTAIIIGVGSLASMAIVAALSLLGSAQTRLTEAPAVTQSIDYAIALAWALPLAAATLVLFQIYVPVGSGVLNVNLADPIALIAASLLILTVVRSERWPRWRVPNLNIAIALATVALSISLFIGISNFGLTTWAWVNRYLGWFVLLAYGATGALIVTKGGQNARRSLSLTYVGATIAVAALDLGYVFLKVVGFDFTRKVRIEIEGFSQNHNFFAFQMLMAMSAILVFVKGTYLRLFLLSLALTAFWFAGSRSGWIALVFILVVGLYLRTVRLREIVFAVAVAALAASLPFLASLTVSWGEAQQNTIPATAARKFVWGTQREIAPEIIPSAASTEERIVTLIGGWKLFEAHPLFGAGLGAFRNEGIMSSTTGVPLLIHSTPLWLLAELGVVGFLAFSIPFAGIFFQEWKSAGKTEASTLVILCFVAFAAMSGPADMLYQRTFWLLVGAALASSELIEI